MISQDTDIVIIGAGPVGLLCAYLGHLCGLKVVVLDKSKEPLKVGRADALNARSLQLLETVGLFKDLYPQGKICKTSSVWANGQFVSRQSTWWDELEGCLHKHFLMLGQSHLEQLLVRNLLELGVEVQRSQEATDVHVTSESCMTQLLSGVSLQSKFVIGADGSRSKVREIFKVPFEIIRPEIVWAVIDGFIETDFEKVPEIIVFQAETSDVAWIPREGDLDRFYVRMDKRDFSLEEALSKINYALQPHSLSFKDIVWFSRFSVKEAIAERFSIKDKVFLAGDACHIHSVNGGQGLNTGIGDAFNLIWKLSQVNKRNASTELLGTYEQERKPIALSVVETSGELVRSTKYSSTGTHAKDYVKIVEKRAGNVTGMGIRYGKSGLVGTRLYDFVVYDGGNQTRLYSLLDYSQFTLLTFGNVPANLSPPPFARVIQIHLEEQEEGYWTQDLTYAHQLVLVRPDSYIESCTPLVNSHTV